MKENVDYEEVSRWPVLLTILAIIVVPFRAQLRVNNQRIFIYSYFLYLFRICLYLGIKLTALNYIESMLVF